MLRLISQVTIFENLDSTAIIVYRKNLGTHTVHEVAINTMNNQEYIWSITSDTTYTYERNFVYA